MRAFTFFHYVMLVIAFGIIIGVMSGCASPSVNQDWLYKTVSK